MRERHPPNLVGVGHFLSACFRKKSATPAFGYFIPEKNLNNKIILLFSNKENNKKLFINLFLKLINKKILIIELINISKKINTEESLNRKDLKNKFEEYNFIIFNFFNIKEKNKIIEIINLIF